MPQLLPADVKPQLSLPAGDPGHDDMIAGYIAAAEAHVLAHTKADLDGQFPDGWPADVLQAIRMIVAHWYGSGREAASDMRMAAVPFGVDALLAHYRDFSG